MRWSPPAVALPPDIAEKRAEHRFPAEGEVSIAFDDPLHQAFTGRLIDYSQSGFRVVHSCPGLATGQAVQFSHALAWGDARVVWNRILDGKVETGFIVVRLRPAR